MTERKVITGDCVWISAKRASKIVNLGYHRTIVFLTRPSVRSREVPWGTSRSTYQYWLPDVLALSKTEAESTTHEEAMKMREQEEIDDIHRHERGQDERNYQDYLKEIRQEQNV